MYRKRVFTFLVVLVLLAISTGTQPSAAFTPPDDPSTFGDGFFTFNNEQYHFSFEATMKKPGKGHGSALFENLTAQTQVEVKIKCASIGGSEASLSGKVQDSNDPDFPKGVTVIFAATDGDLVPVPFFPDKITPIFIFPEEFGDCTTTSPLTIFNVEGGSIVIQP